MDAKCHHGVRHSRLAREYVYAAESNMETTDGWQLSAADVDCVDGSHTAALFTSTNGLMAIAPAAPAANAFRAKCRANGAWTTRPVRYPHYSPTLPSAVDVGIELCTLATTVCVDGQALSLPRRAERIELAFKTNEVVQNLSANCIAFGSTCDVKVHRWASVADSRVVAQRIEVKRPPAAHEAVTGEAAVRRADSVDVWVRVAFDQEQWSVAESSPAKGAAPLLSVVKAAVCDATLRPRTDMGVRTADGDGPIYARLLLSAPNGTSSATTVKAHIDHCVMVDEGGIENASDALLSSSEIDPSSMCDPSVHSPSTPRRRGSFSIEPSEKWTVLTLCLQTLVWPANPEEGLVCDLVAVFDRLKPPEGHPPYDILRNASVTAMSEHLSRAACSVELQDQALSPHRVPQAINHGISQLLAAASGCGSSGGITVSGLVAPGVGQQVNFHDQLYHAVFLSWVAPELARRHIDHIFSMLDSARRWARALSIPKGALFPFRTIGGSECVTFFTASSARFHVNADLAFGVQKFLAMAPPSVLDDAFKLRALEFLLETAHVFLFIGAWGEGGKRFRIDCVSGPDEYAGLVDDDLYTHVLARRHMLFAAEFFDHMVAERGDVSDMLARIQMPPDTPSELRRAAQAIVLARHPQSGVLLSHRHFESRLPWPEADTAPRFPLSLHYNPLVIYRRKVIQTPAVLLAMLCCTDDWDTADFQRAIEYYEPLCTFDSPEALAIVAAAKFRAFGAAAQGATEQLLSILYMNIDRLHQDADEGLRTASMGAAWFILAIGVFRLRLDRGGVLRCSPILPVGWQQAILSATFRGSTFRIRVNEEAVTYEHVAGPTVRLVHTAGVGAAAVNASALRVALRERRYVTVATAVSPRVGLSPLRDGSDDSGTAQFEGVILQLESLIEDIDHLSYEAWKTVLEPFLADVARRERRTVALPTYEEFVDIFLFSTEEASSNNNSIVVAASAPSATPYVGLQRFLSMRGITMETGQPTDAEVMETHYGLANAKVSELEHLTSTRDVRANDGVLSCMRSLANNGVKMAVVSRTRSLDLLLAKAGIDHVVAPGLTTIDGDEVRARRLRGRPHMDLFEAAARKMHVPPSRCAVIISHLSTDYDVASLTRFAALLHAKPLRQLRGWDHRPAAITDLKTFPPSLAALEELVEEAIANASPAGRIGSSLPPQAKGSSATA